MGGRFLNIRSTKKLTEEDFFSITTGHIRELLKAGEGHRLTLSLGSGEWEASIDYPREGEYITGDYEGELLVLRYDTYDTGREVDIPFCVQYQPSHLGRGMVPYLVSSGGVLCRRLFIYRGLLLSRKEIGNFCYKSQLLTPRQRKERYTFRDMPSLYHRRTHHRGKLTKFAEKYISLRQKVKEAEQSFYSRYQ